MKPTIEKKVKRGRESWTFIYCVFAILLASIIFLISAIPTNWVYKTIIFAIATLVLVWLCLLNVRFQNRIVGWKSKLEDKWKKI